MGLRPRTANTSIERRLLLAPASSEEASERSPGDATSCDPMRLGAPDAGPRSKDARLRAALPRALARSIIWLMRCSSWWAVGRTEGTSSRHSIIKSHTSCNGGRTEREERWAEAKKGKERESEGLRHSTTRATAPSKQQIYQEEPR